MTSAPRALRLSLIGLLCAASVRAQIKIDSPGVRIVFGEDATVRSLVAKNTDRECVPPNSRYRIADIAIAGKTFPAESLKATQQGFELRFKGADTVLTYAVEPADAWIVFRLAGVKGTRPESMAMLRLPVSLTETVGDRLNIAFDGDTAVCLMAANRQPDCSARRRKECAMLNARTQDAPGPRLEGCAVALIACPTDEFKRIARNASHAFGMPTSESPDGTPVKDTEAVRGSYFFLSFGEKDVERMVEYCRRAGISQVMMSSGAWCSKVGHYVLRERNYPNGLEGLKNTVDRLHEAGILVGMHTFASKISKTDAYVTPVPDKRFWRRWEAVIATDITADQDEIRVKGSLRDWAGSSASKQKFWEGGVGKHREVVIDDEIIRYESIGPEGTWNTFQGCVRGAWGTQATGHRAEAAAVHYGVDGCINGYIIDQETDLLGEVADRLAGIFNYCGFDMVYFDGGEDVDRRRFRYYVSNFQEQAMRRFTRRPILHMGTIMTHRLWHSFARSSTVDTYLNTLHGAIIAGRPPEKWPTVKDHTNRSVRYMLRMRKSMMPGELGWFGIWPKGADTDGLQLDEAEYLMCKSLGYDVPISLQTSFRSMEAHVLTPEILNIVREYETLRLARAVPEEVSAKLQELDRDFIMIREQTGGKPQFVEVEEVPLIGGAHEVRAFVGAVRDGTAATLWHYCGEGTVTVALDPMKIRMVNIAGDSVPFSVKDGKPVLPANSSRNTLLCKGISAAELKAALAAGEVWVKPPTLLFVRASDLSRTTGKMAKGSEVGIKEPGAFGDVIVSTGRSNYTEVHDWFAEYTVDIPSAGDWNLWARVRYPSGRDDSFGLVLPGQEVTLNGLQVLGNCGVNEKRWHWTGRGSGSTTLPPGSPIAFHLEPGPFTFRIYAREAPGTPAQNPRLDLICLCDTPGIVPTDEDARRHLSRLHE